jgi:threonyl-tRNA synthetase
MKALLLHCKNYHIKVGLLANRPSNVQPEPVNHTEQAEQNCVVALITVEPGDTTEKAAALGSDIQKMVEDIGHQRVVILPFAHLSNKLADSQSSIIVIKALEEWLPEDYQVTRSHFGSHKELLFDVFGHPGNARFREY